MTKMEMTLKLAEKLNVSPKEAETALEFCEWDILDAALMLEREQGEQRTAYSTEAAPEPAPPAEEKEAGWKIALGKLGRLLRKLLECGNRNRFEVHRNDEIILEVPVTVLVLLMLFAFWVCIPLLVIGLFLRCRYSFKGPELGKEFVNKAMDKAAETAEKVREEIVKKD